MDPVKVTYDTNMEAIFRAKLPHRAKPRQEEEEKKEPARGNSIGIESLVRRVVNSEEEVKGPPAEPQADMLRVPSNVSSASSQSSNSSKSQN